jgi:hypothetical protein
LKKGNLSEEKKAGIIASTALLGTGRLIAGMISWMRRRNLMKNNRFEEVRKGDVELPIFDLSSIAHAVAS